MGSCVVSGGAGFEARGIAHPASAVEVLIVCSCGGHLFDALSIAPAWADRSRAWVSFDKADVRSLLSTERVYYAYGPTNRNGPNLLRNVRLAHKVLRDTRPRVVVTTGAGVGVPFAWVARVRGARIVYVECAGRVDRPSLSARLIRPVASRRYAQWPELAKAWKGARYAGNVLLSARPDGPTPDGTGVLITVGTNEAPFDRLVHAAAGLGEEPVVVQHGASNVRPHGARCLDYLPFDDLDRLIGSSRVVVTHAGIGSVATALSHGRRPVIVPRLRRLGEAVDDHQVFFARKLEEAGLATVIEDVARLPAAVAGSDHRVTTTGGPDLSAAIRRELDALLAR
jgi:UDP-N-acetylglucosamine transferase subunit ALG13